MKIAIACDHAGPEYKDFIVEILRERDIDVIDKGTNSSESVDYPDFAHPASKLVHDGEVDLGILVCGSGNGVAMTANKYANVRAAVCWSKELAALARQHNNANMITIPARFTSMWQAGEIVKAFLDSEFEGGRHARRVDKISC